MTLGDGEKSRVSKADFCRDLMLGVIGVIVMIGTFVFAVVVGTLWMVLLIWTVLSVAVSKVVGMVLVMVVKMVRAMRCR